MPKYWIVKNLELVKKVYVVDAYNKPSAILTVKSQAPHSVEVLQEVGYEIESINEYEYHKDWANGPHQKDWIISHG